MRNVPINGKFLACKRKKLKMPNGEVASITSLERLYAHKVSTHKHDTVYSQLNFYAHAKSRAQSRAGITISCGAVKIFVHLSASVI